MKLWKRFRDWQQTRFVARALANEAAGKPPESVAEARIRGVSAQAVARMKRNAEATEHKTYVPPKGVLPKPLPELVTAGLAMDDGTDYGFLNGGGTYGGVPGGIGLIGYGIPGFRGYPYYAALSQLPEYRKITVTLAEEMSRKWIKLRGTGDDDKTEVIQTLNEAMIKFRLRDAFRTMAEYDGFFGRGQLYIDVQIGAGPAWNNPVELALPLVRDPRKIAKGSLLAFRPVEPLWTYPGAYNSDNPLGVNFYQPNLWFCMGKTVHGSRLLTFVGHAVPDILKASYNFGGLSMSQMAEPYVNAWLRTRDSVSDIVHSFSLSGIATNMETVLQGGGGEQMAMRAEMFNVTRDNRGLLTIDKDTEEYFQHDTPLSGLDKLQAQSQEQMAAVAGIPLVKLLGVSPAGLNATSEGEIQVFYDHIHAKQESEWRDKLQACLEVLMCSELGAIDAEITFDFEPLEEPNPTDVATIRKTEADTDAVYITAGVITPSESRDRLINEPSTPYAGLESATDPETIDDVMSAAETARAQSLMDPEGGDDGDKPSNAD